MSKVDAHADFENDISTASADKTENDLRKASIPDLPIEDDYDIPPPVPPHRTSVTLERPKSANANSCEENAQINTNSGLRYLCNARKEFKEPSVNHGIWDLLHAASHCV